MGEYLYYINYDGNAYPPTVDGALTWARIQGCIQRQKLTKASIALGFVTLGTLLQAASSLIVLTSSSGLNKTFPLLVHDFSTWWCCCRLWSLLEDVCMSLVVGLEFMISPNFQVSLSASCMQLRCDLRVLTFVAKPFHQYENLVL